MLSVIPFVSALPAPEQARWLKGLRPALPFATITPFAEVSDADRLAAKVAIVANPDPAELLLLPNLLWVQGLWAGVEKMVPLLKDRAFDIVRLEDPTMSESMAEAVLSWVLYLHRDMPAYGAQQRRKEWTQHLLAHPSERRIGILGLGNMGLASARRLTANGFPVLGWSRTAKQVEGVETFHGEDGLVAMLGKTTHLVILTPLTEETRGLIDTKRLAQLPKGASLINFARGPVVKVPDLIAALDSRYLHHAVLDVFDTEPLPVESPLWDHPHVTVLPHITAPTTISTAAVIVADNLSAFFEKGAIPKAVDKTRGY
jgi:glyoxylate/hydroxypyruvate reductase A